MAKFWHLQPSKSAATTPQGVGRGGGLWPGARRVCDRGRSRRPAAPSARGEPRAAATSPDPPAGIPANSHVIQTLKFQKKGRNVVRNFAVHI